MGRDRLGLSALCAADTARGWRRDATLLPEDSSSITIGSRLTGALRASGSSSIRIYFDGEGWLNESGRECLGVGIACVNTGDLLLDAPVMRASSATASEMVLLALGDAPVVVSLGGGAHFGGGRANMDLAELRWRISGGYLTGT